MARTLLERIMSGEDTQQPAEVGVGPSEPSPQNDPTLGQSSDSEVAMDVYGGQENTIITTVPHRRGLISIVEPANAIGIAISITVCTFTRIIGKSI